MHILDKRELNFSHQTEKEKLQSCRKVARVIKQSHTASLARMVLNDKARLWNSKVSSAIEAAAVGSAGTTFGFLGVEGFEVTLFPTI